MTFHRLLSALLVAAFLTACADQQNAPKQTIGTLLGAGAGALLGSQVGGGRGQLAAVAIGALGGAFLGSQIGKSMDDTDKLKAAQAQQAALETNPTGQSTAWHNPDTGHSGRVTPTRTYETSQGEDCREYQHEVIIDGRTEVVKGTACRRPDGTWRTIN